VLRREGIAGQQKSSPNIDCWISTENDYGPAGFRQSGRFVSGVSHGIPTVGHDE
jgi:hypothetical protein